MPGACIWYFGSPFGFLVSCEFSPIFSIEVPSTFTRSETFCQQRRFLRGFRHYATYRTTFFIVTCFQKLFRRIFSSIIGFFARFFISNSCGTDESFLNNCAKNLPLFRHCTTVLKQFSSSKMLPPSLLKKFSGLKKCFAYLIGLFLGVSAL